MSSSPNERACLFVNFVSECDKWGHALEEALALEEELVDFIAVNGGMDQEEKFSFIRLFTTATIMPKFNPRVLVATVAANTGIDQEDLVHVSRVGISCCVLLIISILSPRKLESSAATDYDGLNTVILVKSMARCNELKHASTAENKLVDRLSLAQQNAITLKLSPAQVHKNTTDAYTNAIESLALYVLSGLGCVHLNFQLRLKCSYLASHNATYATESTQSISYKLCIRLQLSSSPALILPMQ